MSISDNDFMGDGIDDWLSDGIDGTIQIKFVKPNERRRSGGTLFKRNESDIYTARFIDADGRRVDRSTGCTSLAEAEAVLDRWVAESRVLAFLRRAGPSTERDIRTKAGGGFQRRGDIVKALLQRLQEEHREDPSRGLTVANRPASERGGRPTLVYALPSSPCRCDGCKPRYATMTSGIRTVRQLVAECKKIEASNRLVVLRREVIELHDLAEDGGFRCVPYCVPLDEVRTKTGQIEWIRHLCEKSWITPTHILKFIDACEDAHTRKESA